MPNFTCKFLYISWPDLTWRAALLSTACIALPAHSWAQTSSLPPEPIDEIIVTGSPLGRTVDEAITGVSILSGGELADRLAPTIGETLKHEPGVSSSFFGAGASRPVIRGQGGARVRVLTNGIGSIDASSASPDHAVAAEPAQAERIEVLRGAALLRYGSSGAGGVINVIDGRIPDVMPDGTSGALRLGASSTDLGRQAAISLDQALSGTLALHIDGAWRKADDYHIPGYAETSALRAEEIEHALEHDEPLPQEIDGRMPNSQAQSNALSAGLSHIGEQGFLGLSVHRFETDYGIPAGHVHAEEEGDHEEAPSPVSIALDQTRFDLNGRIDTQGLIESWQVFAGYADYKHKELEGSETGTIFTNKGWEARLEAIAAERGNFRSAYGLHLRSRDFSAIGEEAFVPPATSEQAGLYMFSEYDFSAASLEDVHLEGALRYEHMRHATDDKMAERGFDLFSASLGGDMHLSDTIRLGVTAFRTERAPTSEELYSNGPHLATSQYQIGSLELKKEISTGLEAAFRHRHGGHFITLNAFITDYDNYIYERALGSETDGLPAFQYSSSDARFTGFELQTGYDLAQVSGFDLSVDAMAEYVRAKTDDGNLPRIPPLSLLTGIEAQNDQFSYRAELDFSDRQNKTSAYETKTDSYAQLNLFASWQPSLGDQTVRLSVSALNLLDTEARQHSSFLKDRAPLPGRNIRFSFSSEF